MKVQLLVVRAGPLSTIQDAGRFGMLEYGISASGPMDRSGYFEAAALLGTAPEGGIEFTTAGIELLVKEGRCRVGMAGGHFRAWHNDVELPWPTVVRVSAGDRLSILPGTAGNFGYLRFDHALGLPKVLGSLSTNSRARLGGLSGRSLQAGDTLDLLKADSGVTYRPLVSIAGPIRVTWGLHAEAFSHTTRELFGQRQFIISHRHDRMGVRLHDPHGVFAATRMLSLVSDPVVAGDIQILGDGTPVVLMRDHQPTGGYPRIATVTSADLDRLAQLRPGSPVAFTPVSVDHAHRAMQGQP